MDNLMVSICCITYNHEKYIADAMESFLMQECNFKFEILIHDDASTDKTPDIIREYEAKYPDVIKPIYQSENKYSQGVKISPTYLYPNAKGKYIAICEGDDYWTDPNKLQLQVEYMEKNPKCSLYCHASNFVYENGTFIDKHDTFPKDMICSMDDILNNKKHIIATASMLFRQQYALNLPKFYFNAPVGDFPLQLFLASKGYVYYKDSAMLNHRTGVPGSWSTNMKLSKTNIKRIELYIKLKNMLIEFDEFTDGVFRSELLSAMDEMDFNILLAKKKCDQMKSTKYKRFYRKLSIRARFSMNLECKLPRLHLFMKRFKDNIFKYYKKTTDNHQLKES